MILEKALAKFHGSYSLMVGGGDGKPVGYGGLLMALSGGPWYWMTIGKELPTEEKVTNYLRWMAIKVWSRMERCALSLTKRPFSLGLKAKTCAGTEAHGGLMLRISSRQGAPGLGRTSCLLDLGELLHLER